MFSTIYAGAVFGLRSYIIQVEADISRGLPCFQMAGSLGSEVKEAAERVRIALKNSGVLLPPMHIAVNLSPADRRKEGTGFDLPIAIALLTAMEKLDREKVKDILFIGELGLAGELKPVRGILPILREASSQKLRKFVVPSQNRKEAAVLENIEIYGAENLSQVIEFLTGEAELKPEPLISWDSYKNNPGQADFADVYGQKVVKRAATIAAAGFHHILISGPPGAGKTMILKRLPLVEGRISYETV